MCPLVVEFSQWTCNLSLVFRWSVALQQLVC